MRADINNVLWTVLCAGICKDATALLPVFAREQLDQESHHLLSVIRGTGDASSRSALGGVGADTIPTNRQLVPPTVTQDTQDTLDVDPDPDQDQRQQQGDNFNALGSPTYQSGGSASPVFGTRKEGSFMEEETSTKRAQSFVGTYGYMVRGTALCCCAAVLLCLIDD